MTFFRHFCSGLIAASIGLLGTSAFGAESAAGGADGVPSASAKSRTPASTRKPGIKRSMAQPRVVAKLDPQNAPAAQSRSGSKAASTARQSMGELEGLRSTHDSLALKSSVALVMDQDTDEVLFSKNSQAVLPIASITKLMTAVVVTDAALPLDEVLTVTQDDVDTEKGSRSRLSVGTQLTREEMLHLALMSSENRAAHALGRNYPGGLAVFVEAMNAKARSLGMTDTHYVEPTGLSSRNQSSAHDLATLVKLAHTHPLIRELSTSPQFLVDVGNRKLQYHNTNRLVSNPTWDIGLQKTGYITEAGRCLVMQASLAGRKLIMVFLDSSGLNTRLADAERVRRWVTQMTPKPVS